MRDELIKRIEELGTRVLGFEYLFHKLREMSNMDLLELYVEMRIEQHYDMVLTPTEGDYE